MNKNIYGLIWWFLDVRREIRCRMTKAVCLNRRILPYNSGACVCDIWQALLYVPVRQGFDPPHAVAQIRSPVTGSSCGSTCGPVTSWGPERDARRLVSRRLWNLPLKQALVSRLKANDSRCFLQVNLSYYGVIRRCLNALPFTVSVWRNGSPRLLMMFQALNTAPWW